MVRHPGFRTSPNKLRVAAHRANNHEYMLTGDDRHRYGFGTGDLALAEQREWISS